MLIRLSHHKGLGYAPVTKKTALPLPEHVTELARNGAMVVSFRPPPSGRPDRHVKKITAVERFLWAKADQLVFYGIQADSPLAPLILWDAAHMVEIGSTLALMGDQQSQSFLERPYFSEAFDLVENDANGKVFVKRALLPAEQDAGLDAWTFGIPVGPEDATLLNATVKRILDLDVPQKEILLCGRPGANFKYFDQVRIVGEDITAPPVKICAKKNRLAQEACHPNLCIIHDRVFLPSHFYSAIKEFGDFYPLTTLQSVFFDDKYNLVPRRYSDFGVSYRAKTSVGKGLMRDNDTSKPNVFSPSVLPIVEMSGFFSGSPLRFDMGAYPTGSMYLCKRSVWAAYPQNENLHWIEFEDLEHAYRAVEGGVPSRVNPHAITQSLISRPLLGRVAGSYIEPMKGPPRLSRTWSEFVPLPRKPAIKATYDTALAGMHRFAEKYVPGPDPVSIPTAAVLRSARRLETVLNILSRVRVPMSERSLRQFISDYEKWVILDQLPFSFVENVCHRLLVERESPVQVLVSDNEILRNHFANRPKGGTFCAAMSDYLQRPSAFLVLGTLISAVYLFSKRKRVLYLKGGPLAYFRALMNSTPFRTEA
jgi:hypothetical protein